MKKLKQLIINFPLKHYKTVIAFILLITIFLGSFILKIDIDTDPENMLEKHEVVRVTHNKVKKQFDLSDIIVLGVINEKNPNGVFNPETLRHIYEITGFAKTLQWEDKSKPGKLNGVIEIDLIAPSTVDHITQQSPGTIQFDWLMPQPPKTQEEALLIKEKALSNPMLKNRMISEDGKAISLYLPITDKQISYEVYTKLKEKINTFNATETYHITGLPIAEGAIGVEMFTQMVVVTPLTMLVIFSLLLIFFRRFSLIILPMIIATASVITALGLLIACGFPVHILSSMLPVFLMSIAIVDSIHVLSEFFDAYSEGKGKIETIKEVMDKLFTPILYTSLTTSVGFLSLTFTSIPPARVFGGFLSFGIMVAWLYTILFIPAYIMLLPEKILKNFGLTSFEAKKQSWLSVILEKIGFITFKYSKSVLLAFLILVIISIWGISRININDNYAKRFSTSHPIRIADIALNKHFGGTYTAFLVLEGQNTNKISLEIAKKTQDNLKNYAKTISHDYKKAPQLATNICKQLTSLAKKSHSYSDFLNKAINESIKLAENSSDEDYYTYQELQNFFALEKEHLKIFKQPEVLKYIANLQAYLKKEGLIGKSHSISDIVKKIHQELVDGKPKNYKIPDKMQTISECYLQYQQSHRPGDLWHLLTPDFMTTNIWLHFKTGDSQQTEKVVKAVDKYITTHKPPVKINYYWAGLHYINLFFQNKMFWDMLGSFIGSFIIVFFMMTLLFRSFKWGILCMIPLSITVIVIYGVIGLIGKDYDMPIAVLGVLSLGIAVDFAIHFLERSKSSYKQTGSWQQTLKIMYKEPARAISRNVMVIAIGFLPLLISPLVPYKITGLMLFAILSLSGLITLLVLPALLKELDKRSLNLDKKEKK